MNHGEYLYLDHFPRAWQPAILYGGSQHQMLCIYASRRLPMTRGTPATSPGAASFLFVFYKSKPTRLNTDGAAATCVPCASPVFASFPILTVATCLSVDRNEPGPPQLRAISTELSKNGDRMWKRATWSCGLTLGDITQKKSSGVP